VEPGDKPDGRNQVTFDGPGKEQTFYRAGAKTGLFIMLKQGGAWAYATVSPDGARVLQSGRIESCMGCHRKATHDSLFGDYMEQKDPMRRDR